MFIVNIIALLGGLALFLYGVSLMGDGLSKAAGSQMERVLYRLTSNRFKGIILGVGVTALIQSSTATSVMSIGFVNSGLMKFAQAVSIILGSIVGTSITGWIVSLSSIGGGGGWTQFFSTTFITGVFALVGIILFKFCKKQRQKYFGSILLGFAVLMFGMSAMSAAVTPLAQSEAFTQFLTKFSNPLLGILVGLVFTAIIQSSAAAVGILQALSMTGALSFAESYPVILGIAVGGALPVLISALGASLNARRTALVHLIIDIIGAVFCGAVFYIINAVHPLSIMDMTMSPVSLAAVNTIFRVVTVIVLAPCIGLLEKLVCVMMKEKESDKVHTNWDLLEERLLMRPVTALGQSRLVINSMAEQVRANLKKAIALLWDYREEAYVELEGEEDLVDQYEDKLGSYLIKVNTSGMRQQQNADLYKYLHAITDFERISDHAFNIAELAQEVNEKKIRFSDEAKHELDVLEAAVKEVVDTTVNAFIEADSGVAEKVEPLEELIDTLCDELKFRHTARVRAGICTLQNGFVFNDLLNNYERISDHCSNIALAMFEVEQDNLNTHNYVESLMEHKSRQFNEYFEGYKAKYSLNESKPVQ